MFLAFVVASVLGSGPSYSAYTSFLDPSPIGYPNNWYSNIIDLSSNHAGSTTVTLTIYCNIIAILYSGACVAVNIPGFDIQPIPVTLSTTQPVQNDNFFVFSIPTLPAAGVYGPVSVFVYSQCVSSNYADIIASASAYGSVQVLPAKKTAETLVLSYNAATVGPGASGVGVIFTFSLSTTLYANDYLVITVPNPFAAATTATTDFFEYNSTGNNGNLYFLSTRGVQSTTPASVSTVTVYGINGYNSSVGSVTVSGVLNGITTPSYFGPLNTNAAVTAAWTLEIFRFGTHSTRALYSGTGPTGGTSGGAGLVPGTVELNWVPANSYLTYVYSGITTYMDLRLLPSNDIPSGGSIKVTFTNVNIANSFTSTDTTLKTPVLTPPSPAVYYILASPFIYFNLLYLTNSMITNSGTVLTLPVANKIPANTPLVITNLVTFLGNPTVSVTTLDAASHIIGAVSAQIYNYQSSGYTALGTTTATEPSLQIWSVLASGTPSPLIPGLNGNLIFAFSTVYSGSQTLSNPLATTGITTMSLSGPFSDSSAAQDTAFALGINVFIGIPSYYPSAVQSATAYSTGVADATSRSKSNLNFVSSPTQFTFKSPYATASSKTINFIIYPGTVSGSPAAGYVPKFVSNIYTKYEICFQFTVSSTSSYGFCKPLTTFPTAITTTFTTLCASSGQGGLTANLAVTPTALDTGLNTLGLNFKITVATATTGFDPALGTGVVNGGPFPASVAGNPTFPPHITISWNPIGTPTTTTINYVPNPPNSLTNSAISFYFPFIPLVPSAVYTAMASVYLQSSDGSQYAVQVDSTGAATVTAASSGTNYAFSPTPVQATSGATVTADSRISSLVIPIAFTGTTGISIILPAGFIFSTTTPPRLYGKALVSLDGIFSLNQNYAYPSLYAATLGSGVTTITLTNLIAPSLAPVIGSVSSNLIIATTSGTSTTACTDQTSVALTIRGVALSVTSIFPATGSTIFAPGPRQPNLVLSCSVAVPGSIIGGTATAIVITLGFSPTSGTYSIIGGGLGLSGSVSSGTIRTGFITASIVSASITFTITVTTPTPTGTIGGFSSITIGNSTGVQYYASVTQALVTNTARDTAVVSGISSVSAFPNTIGAQNVFFQIQFYPSVGIPAGSTIRISGGENFISDAYANDNTWSTLGFTSALVSSSGLILVTRLPSAPGTAITIRKDFAYNIGLSQTAAGAAWLINVAYGGASFITDPSTTTAVGSNSITYAETPSATLSSFEITTNTSNAGETGYYKFSFLFSSALLSSYSIVIDVPSYFDATFGPLTSISTSSLAYLSAASSIGSSFPICSVNHWLITCSLGVQVNSGPIDIEILGTNPPVQTSAEPYSLYIVDSSSNIKGLLQSSSFTPLITPIPAANVDLQSVLVTNNQALYSDYTFIYTYLGSEIYEASGYVSVLFPAQYNFYRDQTTSTASATGLGSYFIRTASRFNLLVTVNSNNLATFTFSDSQIFLARTQVTLTVKDITNPTVSSSYAAYSTLNTALDTVYGSYFSAYDFWTSKFTLYTSTSPANSSTAWTSRSYPNVNAAFVGFLTVNLLSFSVPTVNVIPGTYSPFYTFTTASGTVVANSLILNPTSTGLTIFPTTLTLYPTAAFGLFEVGAPITAVPSICYITWTVVESPTTSGKNLYLPIYKSQVQVYSPGAISITATAAPPILNNGISLPIVLSISPYYTYSSFVITPTLTSKTISFSPSVITFTSGSNSNSVNSFGFQVLTVNATSGQYFITLALSGTDAAAYSFSGSILITVGGTISAISLSSLAFSGITSNSFIVTVQSTGSANIYWVVSTTYAYRINPNYSNLTYVKQYAFPVTGATATTQTTLLSQYTMNNRTLNVLRNTSYLNYTVSLLMAANANVLYNMDTIPGGSKSYSTYVNGLLASNSYTITVWADNFNGTITNITGNVTTSSVPGTVFTISFTSTPINLSSSLVPALANITLEPAYLFINLSEFRRNLAAGLTASAGLVGNPINTQSTSALSIAAASVTPTALGSTLADLGAINATVGSVIPVTSASPSILVNPSFTSGPSSKLFFKVIRLSYTSAVSGQIYYVLEYNPSYNNSITATNVLLGVGRNSVALSAPSSSGMLPVTSGTSVINYGLFNLTASPSGTYWLTLNLCNSVGVCQANSSISSFRYIYNNIPRSRLSSSKNLVLALCTLLALIL